MWKVALLRIILGVLEPKVVRRSWMCLKQRLAIHILVKALAMYHSPAVFEGTIDENIRMYSTDEADQEMSLELRLSGLRTSCVWFSGRLARPSWRKRFVTFGGQRQRLALSRELYREPGLLVLDEATSALDGVSEEAIKATIRKVQGEITVIVVAHRLTTIEDADLVFLMESGRIVETGPFNKLIKNANSKFYKLAQQQGIV